MKRMIEEQYWKRTSGEVIAVGDMNEHHAKNVLRKMLKKSRQRGLDALEMRDKMRLISGMLDDIRSELL
jgi:polyhydroxyalkanoate synthesis regulator phasin